jgi:hypothetical protein
MNVNGYVEWINEASTYSEWERCAEFKYSDDAIEFAKSAYANRKGPYSFRAVRCHASDSYAANGIVWHSDDERDRLYRVAATTAAGLMPDTINV